MKYCSWILLLGLIFFGCKKTDTNSKGDSSLVGKWELTTVQAGLTGEIKYPPGSGNSLEFAGSTYKRYVQGILTMSGNYTIVPDNNAMNEVGLAIAPGDFENRIIFNEDMTAPKIFFNISNRKLVLLSGFFPLDGGTMTVYTRK